MKAWDVILETSSSSRDSPSLPGHLRRNLHPLKTSLLSTLYIHYFLFIFKLQVFTIHFTIYSFSCFAFFVPSLVDVRAEVQAELATKVMIGRPVNKQSAPSECSEKGPLYRAGKVVRNAEAFRIPGLSFLTQ